MEPAALLHPPHRLPAQQGRAAAPPQLTLQRPQRLRQRQGRQAPAGRPQPAAADARDAAHAPQPRRLHVRLHPQERGRLHQLGVAVRAAAGGGRRGAGERAARVHHDPGHALHARAPHRDAGAEPGRQQALPGDHQEGEQRCVIAITNG